MYPRFKGFKKTEPQNETIATEPTTKPEEKHNYRCPKKCLWQALYPKEVCEAKCPYDIKTHLRIEKEIIKEQL